MADWKFLNVLQFSIGFKGTILDGLAEKYLVFPTEEDCAKLCNEAYQTLKNHYETIYKNDKEALIKISEIMKDPPKLISSGGSGTYHTPSEYDPGHSRHMFSNIIWKYQRIQKLEDEILEKQAIERMKAELDEKKKLLKSEQHVNCSKCPTCNK